MRVKIYTLNELDKEKWNEIATKNSVIFQTYEWGFVHRNRNKIPFFFVVENNGR